MIQKNHKILIVITYHEGINETYFKHCLSSTKAINNKFFNVHYKTFKAHRAWKSRNHALIYALKNNYDFFVNVDGDDYIDINYVENMLDTYEKSKSDIIYTAYKHTDNGYIAIPRENLSSQQIQGSNGLSAFLMSRPETLLEIGGYVADDNISEDWVLNYQAAKNGLTYSVNRKGGYNYRIHDDQVTKSKNWNLKIEHTRKYLI